MKHEIAVVDNVGKPFTVVDEIKCQIVTSLIGMQPGCWFDF